MLIGSVDSRYRSEPSAGIAVGFTTVCEIEERKTCCSSNRPAHGISDQSSWVFPGSKLADSWPTSTPRDGETAIKY